MDYISTKEASLKWGISERRVRVLCSENRIEGAFSLGKTWNIPKNAEKPFDRRFETKKQVVVFGGAHSVGEAIAEKFLNLHCDVVSIDKSENLNKNIKSITIKYTDESIAKACEQIESVDLLVVYPSIYLNASIIKTSKQDLDNIVDLNVKTSFYVMKHLIEKLRKSNGQIIIMSSSAGVMPEPMSPTYCMSQASLIMLGKCLAVSEGKNKVRVNTILMGPAVDSKTFTDVVSDNEIREWKKLNPLNSMCEIKDFVDAVVYLSGFAGSKVDNMTGVQLSVDCGESITGQLFKEV
jgi:NAD(P)-dependent dehydrogenase (short-subunit alcohol dehydrogenase family)